MTGQRTADDVRELLRQRRETLPDPLDAVNERQRRDAEARRRALAQNEASYAGLTSRLRQLEVRVVRAQAILDGLRAVHEELAGLVAAAEAVPAAQRDGHQQREADALREALQIVTGEQAFAFAAHPALFAALERQHRRTDDGMPLSVPRAETNLDEALADRAHVERRLERLKREVSSAG